MTDGLIEAFEDDEEVTLPKRWVVCPACRGKSTMTLKRIAISADEFYEDPDFADDYLSGVYDEPCDECNGRTTIEEVDTDALSPEMCKAWFDWVADEAEMRHTEAMERRMGA